MANLQWNRQSRFTGWADIGLTAEGAEQTREGAKALMAAGVTIDLAYASVLSRCIRSLWILLEAMNCLWIPQILDWRLNERHYGGLTGSLKLDAEHDFGKDAVLRWRRDYEARPPSLDAAANVHIPIDGRYVGVATRELPASESLSQTVARVDRVWRTSISEALRQGSTVLIMGHGNSLRALIKIIEDVSCDG